MRLKKLVKKNHIDRENILYTDCLAKLNEGDEGSNIFIHGKIVGLVAKEIIEFYSQINSELTFLKGSPLVAACHDIGKINPHFQEKIRRNLNNYTENSFLGLKEADPNLESKIGYHSGVSYIALKDRYKVIARIIGRHHGESPEVSEYISEGDEILGGKAWAEARYNYLNDLFTYFGSNFPSLTKKSDINLISGLTTLSDWIGSGKTFDYANKLNDLALKKLVKEQVYNAGYYPFKIRENLKFSDIFGFDPYPIQEKFFKACKGPGVYLLEAEMGQGKTEAALYAAYTVLNSSKANGVYFALPTQLTSNKIHERFEAFLSQIVISSEETLLIHSNSWLANSQISKESAPGRSWFNFNKRKILAAFAVGTIDQALMSVINVRHGFLRTFGLAGKVVILDEVHTYDSYTGTILDELISELLELKCTVIILSATLTTERCKALLSLESISPIVVDAYPLIISKPKNEKANFLTLDNKIFKKIQIKILHEDSSAINLAKEKLSQGEYVLWIENTIEEAQTIFKILNAFCAENEIESGLLHSNYIKSDRNSKEDFWVEQFSSTQRTSQVGKLLVGTQVLEQSLDIDADFLISRIAPSDMLIQRLGRLWRHKGTNRGKLAEPQMVILMPKKDCIITNPAFAFNKTGFVYSPYILARTSSIWCKLKILTLPKDIKPIIEETYKFASLDEKLQREYNILQIKKAKLKQLANLSLSKNGITLKENEVTRYSEVETSDLLLIKNDFLKCESKIELANGKDFYLKDKKDLTIEQRKEGAIMLSHSIVRVASYKNLNPIPRSIISLLSPYLYLGHTDESILRVGIIGKNSKIRNIYGCIDNENYDLSYTETLGLVCKKKGE